MRLADNTLQLSATDLAKHLACRHLTELDLRAACGEIDRIYRNDPSVKVLEERGLRHEAAHLDYLKVRGYDVVTGNTVEAMRAGVGAIAQADLQHGRWRGRADILIKVGSSSDLGPWSYEVIDTKLASETRGGTILQLCLYSELVAQIQGRMPELMHVVTPRATEPYRLRDYLAYYRLVKSRLENSVATDRERQNFYPDPVEHCDICNWWPNCNVRRRSDDHLSFVAGITKLQIDELHKDHNVTTLADLATMPRQERFIKLHDQARLQLERRATNKPVYELLPFEPSLGLARLPAPSPGDIFLDFEGDPFVDNGGLEYLLGYITLNKDGETDYTGHWALDRKNERRAFESFIDMVTVRQQQLPDLHIYHFSHYEPTALKRLMGRYATREDDLDRLLRAGVFIDLHGITKQSMRASVERYSLKDLEVFFGFERQTDLRDARLSLRHMECALELNELESISPAVRETIEAYNREDCLSALFLRNWLETLRPDCERPALTTGDPSEAVDERRKRALALMDRLLIDAEEGDTRWLLAHMLEFHRREEKAPWWEYFRLQALTDEERIEERSAISGLEFVKRIGGTTRCPIDRYRFPHQDMQIRREDQLHTSTDKFGEVVALDFANRMIDVKKTGAMAEVHPKSVFSHSVINGKEQAESLYRLGSYVADGSHGSAYRPALDLLRRTPLNPDCAVVAIQGPPGAGKTYKAARMICGYLREGRKVGITAVSHKVIRKLIEEVLAAAQEQHVEVRCIEKVKERSKQPNLFIPEATENKAVLAALQDGSAQLAAGTAWLWSREEFASSVDVLFVDEAGQMSLPDALAVSQAANKLVLLGDPQQLEQPLQGTHPPGVAVSALQHILGEHDTIPENRGEFLAETWRLSPSICAFTSELFYEGRLLAHSGLERQRLTTGSGLFYVSVEHSSNQNSSTEEVQAVIQVVEQLLQPGVCWTDLHGVSRQMTIADILIVSPYNAQVFDLAERLPTARIGTVDKFQGQEAPVVIYTMATSAPEDAPRGMEFLYNLNRFNVATSRARCAVILVVSPRLFEPECKTPHRMKLANALCRYLELATPWNR